MDVTVAVQILKWLRDLGRRVKIFERQEFVQTTLRWRFTALLLDLATAAREGAATSLGEVRHFPLSLPYAHCPFGSRKRGKSCTT